MKDFLTQRTTIAETCHASMLQKLRDGINTKQLAMLTKDVRLLQDNVPVHNSYIAPTEAQSCGYEILLHPPNSPDFHRFQKWEVVSEEQMFLTR